MLLTKSGTRKHKESSRRVHLVFQNQVRVGPGDVDLTGRIHFNAAISDERSKLNLAQGHITGALGEDSIPYILFSRDM